MRNWPSQATYDCVHRLKRAFGKPLVVGRKHPHSLRSDDRFHDELRLFAIVFIQLA